MAIHTNIQPLDAEITLLDPAGGPQVRLRFQGPFEGRTVTWDATFRTARQKQSNAIEIGVEGAEGLPLTVTLNLPCIDLPAIRKTVIMIRQYKRLHYGRHEFGTH
ncbi:MAG TPA: hypothetical protein VGE50_11970 [Gammaproteobacteria bacterium]